MQADEIEPLPRIYAGDLAEQETPQNLRAVTRSITLKWRTLCDEGTFVTLSVGFPATYPSTEPSLDVQDSEGDVHEPIQGWIRSIIQDHPKRRLGVPLIDDIAYDIQHALQEEFKARHRGTLPREEDHSPTDEKAVNTLAEPADEGEPSTKPEAQDEEHRMLKHIVDKPTDIPG